LLVMVGQRKALGLADRYSRLLSRLNPLSHEKTTKLE
jgi:hypothetical protein